jgi:hypothetical protein
MMRLVDEDLVCLSVKSLPFGGANDVGTRKKYCSLTDARESPKISILHGRHAALDPLLLCQQMRSVVLRNSEEHHHMQT